MTQVPGPIIVDDHEEWEVSGISDHFLDHRGCFYLVNWKGWSYSTWEPEENLKHSMEVVTEYYLHLFGGGNLTQCS
jgi:hypothetical protein